MYPYNESFWSTAINWKQSISPKVYKRTLFFCGCSIATTYLCKIYPELNWSVGPLEISGAVLGLLMIIRTNAGYDRWWEARKLWGGIVNQSRNLAILGMNYGSKDISWQNNFLFTLNEFALGAKAVLRRECPENIALLASSRLATLIGQALRNGKINGFEFQCLEEQRSQLVDHLGGCERILKTPIPKILDIKVRSFLAIYLILIPLGLTHKTGWYTPVITLLLSYSLLAIDQIGVELQDPFSQNRLSSLPLDDITMNIENSLHSISILSS